MHKLVTLYKMKFQLTPSYLSSLIPAPVENRYPTRTPEDIRSIRCNTQFYQRSFLPAAIRDWNELPASIKNSGSLSIFKSRLTTHMGTASVPRYFSVGDRFLNIQHSRLRTHCSNLHEHLFSKNIIADPSCLCGEVETTEHFLLHCPQYDIQRSTMSNSLSHHAPLSLSLLLYGNSELDYQSNVSIFKAVQQFIKSTRRFELN